MPTSREHRRRLITGAACALVVLVLAAWWWSSTPRQRHLLLNTAQLSLLVASLSVLLATPLSYLCLRTSTPLRRLVWGTLTVLVFVPVYVQTAAWQAGFGGSGWYTIGANSVATPWLGGWRAAIWVHVASSVPWAAWILACGWQSGWRDAERAASLDASPWRVFWWVSVPRARPWLAAALVWVAITTSTELSVVDLFQVDSTARELYTGFALGRSFGEAIWTMAGPLLVWLILALALVWYGAAHFPSLRLVSTVGVRGQLAHRGWLAAGLALWWLIFAAVPLGNLIYDAGSLAGTGRWWRWSLTGFLTRLVTSLPDFRSEILWTLLIGLSAATLVTVCAVMLAGWSRNSTFGAAVTLLTTAAVLALPGPLLGRGLIVMLNHPEWPWLYHLYDASILAPMLAAALRAWPLALALAWVALRDVERRQWQAAALDGASSWKILRSIVVPQILRPCAVVWLLAFSLATGELAATLLVIPPGMETTATRVANLMHTGLREKEAVLCLWHVALGAGAAWLAARITRLESPSAATPG